MPVKCVRLKRICNVVAMIDSILHISTRRRVRLTAMVYSWRAGRGLEMQYAANSVKLCAMVSLELSSLEKRLWPSYCGKYSGDMVVAEIRG